MKDYTSNSPEKGRKTRSSGKPAGSNDRFERPADRFEKRTEHPADRFEKRTERTGDRFEKRPERPGDRFERRPERPGDRFEKRPERSGDRFEKRTDRSEGAPSENRSYDMDRVNNPLNRSRKPGQKPQGSFSKSNGSSKRSSSPQRQFDKPKAPPFEVKAPETPLDPMNLTDLSPALQEACAKAGWTELTPVQSHTLPYIMAKQDMMVQSRTGSGKTGAYLIPTFTQISPERRECQALIIVPTRELALQVEQEARSLFDTNVIRIAAVYGGVAYGKQLDALQRGAHIVIGTPGRVLDHLLKRTLVLDNLRVLIFDEADRMLSIGFYPDMKEIQRYLPKKDLLVNLFSATYPPRVLQLASEFLHQPQMLSLSQGQVHVATSQHFYCECGTMEKDRSLVRIIEKENPASAIIFCNTKANVHYVTSVLQGFGYNADELSADLSQARREQVLKRLRRGDIRFLVATDVAARGIDVPDLSHVFLYEPPDDRESYIHRAGRTGRAGAAGTVISLVDIMQKLEMIRIAKFYKIDISAIKAPTEDEIAKISSDRMVSLLETKRRLATGLELERAKRFLPLVKDIIKNAEESEQLMLLALILDSDYQKSLGVTKSTSLENAPPEVEKPQEPRHFSRHGSRNRR